MVKSSTGSKESAVADISEVDMGKLVDIVRQCRKKKKIEVAYNEIVRRMHPKIQKITYQFFIPGLSPDDIKQEALFALRFKAIKDYDETRGRDGNPFPFDRFAMICIRRHLSTQRKSSFQNKKRVLNTSISLNQDRNDGNNDSLSLSDILPQTDGNVLEMIEQNEYLKTLFIKLFEKLSKFEKEVFILYAQGNSYDQIAYIINKKYHTRSSNVKSVDNALSRIKLKGKDVFDKFGDDNENAGRSQRVNKARVIRRKS